MQDEMTNMYDGIIKEICEKFNLKNEDAVELVELIKSHNEKWLESMGIGCSVCKFNKRNDTKAYCEGAEKSSPLPFCKDYWISEGEW